MIVDTCISDRMEVASNKRPAESEQSADTFAVCTACSRLSANLRVCDKCGSTLSDDNSSQCYSAEPKRPCLDGASVSPTQRQQQLTNGTSTPPCSAMSATTSSSASSTAATTNGETVVASSSASISTTDVRPQALYVNVNNQAFPVLGVGPASTSSSATPGSTVPATLYQNGSTGNALSATPSPSIRGRTTIASSLARPIQPAPTATSVNSPVPLANGSLRPSATPTTSSVTQMALPTYNLQPPPPPFASSVARLPGIVTASAHAPGVSGPVVTPTAASLQTVQVSAIQIRIGVKKFKPMSAVTFKDDGILFTLKDYTYAPVLLNARAILKCKANLNTFSYPVLFLFLESSCMRQIRSIFGLSANDFCPNSPVEMKRCISIFPIFGIEGKSQAQAVMYTIRRSFEAMVRRYPRSSSILEEITNDQAIDMLLDLNSTDSSADSSESAPGDGVAATSAGTSTASAVTSATPAVSHAASVVNASNAQAVLTTALNHVQRIANGTVPSAPNSASTTVSASAAAVSNTAVVGRTSIQAQMNRAQASAPVLQIPTDQARWQMMQKGLIAGGVYHVLMPDGGRQYCLWNGKQLVPCLVQNTEVQLSCVRVRIGSLLANSVGQVRVRADQNSGIFFTIKSDHTGTQEVAIPPDEMASCQVCFSNVVVILMTLNNVGADKLRKKLRLNATIDPAYDPAGSAIYRRHILLFLNSVNRDQEDALKQMKRAGSSTSMFETIDTSKGLSILAQIKLDTTNANSVAQYLQSKQMTGTLGFERLVNEVASSTVGVASQQTVDDDDDDDVIMTQEEVGMKCPYTQQVMKWPVRNNICGHNYERDAIQEFIQRKKGNAKCPFAGCANLVPLRMDDLIDNSQLRDYIKKNNVAS